MGEILTTAKTFKTQIWFINQFKRQNQQALNTVAFIDRCKQFCKLDILCSCFSDENFYFCHEQNLQKVKKFHFCGKISKYFQF